MAKKIVTVNLHNPHAPPDEKKKGFPGPQTYKISREFDPIPEAAEGEEEFNQPRLNKVLGGRVYVDDNNDRFGMPIRPLKPIDLKPGPGTYFVEDEGGANNMTDKCYPIEEAKSMARDQKLEVAN
jgi:hypothetical protein